MRTFLFTFCIVLFSEAVSAGSVEIYVAGDAPKRIAMAKNMQSLSAPPYECIVPNSDFEFWTTETKQNLSGQYFTFHTPVKWIPLYSYMYAILYGMPINIETEFITPDNKAAKMYIGDSSMGADLATIIACTERSKSVTGQYKFSGNSSYATVEVYMTKFNPVYDTSYIVGSGVSYIYTPSNTLSPFQVDITYMDETIVPDTVIIIASYMYGDQGTSFVIDHVMLENTNTNSGLQQYENIISAFPNPAKYELNIELEELQGMASAAIADISGRIIEQKEVYENKFSWNINALAPGIYFLRIEDDEKIYMKKFIKE